MEVLTMSYKVTLQPERNVKMRYQLSFETFSHCPCFTCLFPLERLPTLAYFYEYFTLKR